MMMNKQMLLSDFRSPQNTSLYKGIPMSKYTKEVRKLIRSVVGQPVRFKFRGPRPARPGRSAYSRQCGCIKVDAKTFSVYLR